MRDLNRRYRNRPRPTDVLSFPQEESGVIGVHLGDIVICPAVADRHARQRRHGYRLELGVLVIHGLLHLMGYDHEVDDGEMTQLEETLHRELRLARFKAARS